MKHNKSILITHPTIAQIWHPTKNRELMPTDITSGSQKIVWWLLHYKDEKTGNCFDFEWENTVRNQTTHNSCPYLDNRKIYSGFNDLATTHPHIAQRWHPTKNGVFKPNQIMANSSLLAWWIYPYDDPITSKHFDFVWSAKVNDYVSSKQECPFLAHNPKVWTGFNDLFTLKPDVAKYWHYAKNGDLKPTDVTCGSNQKVWWHMFYFDANTGTIHHFEWRTSVKQQVTNNNCPYLIGAAIWPGYNDLTTTHPQIAKQIHPTKNGNLTANNISSGSNRKIWWCLPYDDPVTGKHFDFEWQSVVYDRCTKADCPFLTGRAVWAGFNDLATIRPDLAMQWHPTKNGSIKSTDVTANSHKIVWWLYPYDDPKTGRHFDFEWTATVKARNIDSGCPFLTGHRIWKGFNDLQTLYPEIAKQWHPTKNGKKTPSDVAVTSDVTYWWQKEYLNIRTGKMEMHVWEAYIQNRINGSESPYITASKMERFVFDLLRKLDVSPMFDKTFTGCKDKKPLPFDIYLQQENIIIECDGCQHLSAIPYFGGQSKFKYQIHHDNIKNDFCKSQNIPLLRIPYIYDPVVDKDKIEKFVLDFIQTKQVPQEIKDFYAKYSFSNYCK